ncbi:hypothetical protein Cgig2_026986 [Carnegiea gigantea]|uniref:Prolamin-like domain-containing protein n=1 Tax=Carnegiea gigantea TaxID=171969 RepID=A0A9Q1JEE0_9CARY|nr:hypothetical protein Cgig2_026986 [Carnegiea gigantea]
MGNLEPLQEKRSHWRHSSRTSNNHTTPKRLCRQGHQCLWPKIYEFVFDNSGILSEKCCEQLLNAGRECHDSDTNSILSEGEFSEGEREEILARHSEVWNLCKRSGHIGGTQPVPAPTVQPLTGCAGKVTSACGPKVYAFVFDKSGVLSKKCCELLLNTGRQCHDSETNSILSEGEFSAEEKKEIMKRHNQVWNLCKKNGHIDIENTKRRKYWKGTLKFGTFARGAVTLDVLKPHQHQLGILSEKCCKQLLNTGRECHNSDTNSILSEGEFSKEEREEILARHSEVWNLRKRSGHIGGTQLVPAPTVQPLTGCAGKVTSACGPKVYAFAFDKSGVLSEKCCKLLLNAGRQCHASETNSILSEGEFSAEEKKEIMKRHNQVWNLCKKNGGFSTEETEEILERNYEVWNLCKRSGHIGGTQATPATIIQPLKGCAGKVTSACAPKIYEFVFDNSGILSEKCCEQLLNAGRECHDSDTNSILSEGEFSKEEREEILERHSEVWSLCKRSGHIGGTQPVPAPTVQPLTGCAGKGTSACGPKVYAFVFDKSGVLSEKCCKLLLNGGRQCHDSETNSILSEGEFSAEEKKEIMKRHNQVWNLCKKNGHIDIENTVF